MNKVAVIARYNETRDFWPRVLDRYGWNTIVFNKKEGANLLPNVGREGHTYFNFIIENYDNLPDEILFTQYDPLDHFKTHSIFGTKTNSENMKRFLLSPIDDIVIIRPTDFDYVVRHRHIDWVDYCKKIFDNFTESDLNRLLMIGSNINGIFRVTKKAISKRPLSFYKNCIKLLSTEVDPESGYFFERMWKYIFCDFGDDADSKISFSNNLIMIGNDLFNSHFSYKKADNDACTFSGGIKADRLWRLGAYGHLFLHETGVCLGSPANHSVFHSIDQCYWSVKKNVLRLYNAECSDILQFHLPDSLDKKIYGKFYNVMQNRWTKKQTIWIAKKMFQTSDMTDLLSFDYRTAIHQEYHKYAKLRR